MDNRVKIILRPLKNNTLSILSLWVLTGKWARILSWLITRIISSLGNRSYTFLNFVSSNNSTTNFLYAYFDLQKGNEDRLKKLQSYLFHLAQLKSEHGENEN